MGTLLRSCAEVCESVELSFGMVSVVDPGIRVLDDSSHAPTGRGYFGDLLAFALPLV